MLSLREAILLGGSGDDVLYGDEYNDHIIGGEGNDIIYGGGGDDRLEGNEGDDIIYGDDGDDILHDTMGTNELYGGDGNDYIRVSGHAWGGKGDDKIYGGDGSEVLYGGDGNDKLVGGSADDLLYGDAGNDVLYGDGGIDLLWGGDGNDTLYGGDAEDELYGGTGNDVLIAGGGEDELYGGEGDDRLEGCWDSDLYVISKGEGSKTIYDTGGTKDTLSLKDLSFLNNNNTWYSTNDGNDLVITLKETNETIRIENFYYKTQHQENCIEIFQFADMEISAADFFHEDVAQQVAAFASAPSFSLPSYEDQTKGQVLSIMNIVGEV